MCVELLRQIEPEIYEQVFRNRSLFYYPEWDIVRWDERNITTDDGKEKKIMDHAFDQVFRNLQDEQRRFVLSFLSEMFPKVNAYVGNRSLSSGGKPSEVEADKKKHIYHPEHFTTYFTLHVQEGYLSSQELDTLIAGANAKPTEGEAQTYFVNYLQPLQGLKKYRFFEKMVRLNDKLGAMQARALAIAVALQSNTLAHDDFDLGEFGTANRLIVQLARRFKDSAEITGVLRDVIEQSTSDALAQRIFYVATEKAQEAFENSAFVDIPALKAALATRMNAKYFVGSEEPIYGPSRTWREWQSLIWWARVNDEERDNVRKYLTYEFEKWPASIGKHVLWLTPSLGNSSGQKIVDDLFPLSQLADLAKKYSSKSYSTESEKSAVMDVIAKYGGSEDTNQKS